MNLSLTIPQLFYDFIARVLPGFLFLFALRVCLYGTNIDPGSIVATQSTTSVASLLESLGFLVICYFTGWFLRGVRWPNLQPIESSEFRTMYQKVRLQHAEAGFRLVKLRAEARLLEASRVGMWIVGCLALAAWILRSTDFVAGASIPHGVWALRSFLPILVGFVFWGREKGAWRVYQGNVKKLHALIIVDGYPRQNDPVGSRTDE